MEDICRSIDGITLVVVDDGLIDVGVVFTVALRSQTSRAGWPPTADVDEDADELRKRRCWCCGILGGRHQRLSVARPTATAIRNAIAFAPPTHTR